MNENERLSEELRNRANVTDGHPISLDDVKRSARKMQWQQRAAAGGVAAVVLAIGIPVGISLANNDKSASPGFATQSPTTTPTPTDTPTQTPDNGRGGVPLTLVGAPRGDAPQVNWIDGTTVHLPQGGDQTLPSAYIDVASYRGGWLGIRFKDGAYTLDRIDGSGKVTSSAPTGPRFAVSVDGTQLTWSENGKLTSGIPSGHSDFEQTVDVAGAGEAIPIGYVHGSVAYETYGTDPARVFTTDFQGAPQEVKGVLAVGGTSQETGMISVQTSSSDTGSCWEVRNVQTGDAAWKTCKYSLGAFSSDGQFVIGYPPYGDGLGPRDVYILDAGTGKEVVHYAGSDTTGAYLSTVVWEGDGHNLLADVYESGNWQLARLSMEGSIETASDPKAGQDTDPGYFIASRP